MFFRRAKKELPPVPQAEPPVPPSATAVLEDIVLNGTASGSDEDAPDGLDDADADDAPATLDFSTTADLKPGDAWLGQEHVIAAVNQAFDIDEPGFNIGVISSSEAGTRTELRRLLLAKAAQLPAPPDCVCLHDFGDPMQPSIVHLPAGRGRRLADGMLDVLCELSTTLPIAFASDDFKIRTQLIAKSSRLSRDTALDSLQHKAGAQNIALLRTPNGFGLAPMHDGRVVKPAVFAQLPIAMRSDIENRIHSLQAELSAALAEAPDAMRAQHAAILELQAAQALPVVSAAFQTLERAFAAVPEVASYLNLAKRALVQNCDLFVHRFAETGSGLRGSRDIASDARMQEFLVNVPSTRAPGQRGAAVVELSPAHLAALTPQRPAQSSPGANHMALAANALHAANGGILLISARDLIDDPHAARALKHVLMTGEIAHGAAGMAVPLKVKAVLMASEASYKALYAADPDMTSLFKILVRCAETFESTAANDMALAERLAGLVARDNRLPLTSAAVGAIIDDSARRSGRKGFLALAEDTLSDLLAEAHCSAKLKQSKVIDADDVHGVLMQRARRFPKDAAKAVVPS